MSGKLKVKANDECHCGSQKKYKKCCLQKDQMFAEESVVQKMQQMAVSRAEPRGEVMHERKFAFQLGYAKLYSRTIDKCMKEFRTLWEDFDKKSNIEFRSAIDIGSGAGVFPFVYAKHFRDSVKYRDYIPVNWFPSEYVNPSSGRHQLDFLKQSILVQHQEIMARDIREDVLFADANGRAVYPNDKVHLAGLLSPQSEKYNGLIGTVLGIDSANTERIAVFCLLDEGKRTISLKPANLTLVKDQKGLKRDITYEQAIEVDKDLDTLDSLHSWTLHIDVMDFGNFGMQEASQSLLMSACALVTCTSLLTCCGHREPMIWKNALSVASYYLAVGGYFIQHDTDEYGGGFGDKVAMRRVGLEGTFRQMELVQVSEPIKHAGGQRMLLVVWKRAGDAKEYQEVLEFAWTLPTETSAPVNGPRWR
jgi:hypothetical protein